jgi:Rps23 Pro-64 3,4-dihydroxylase Tpa1-like proline 4-hydroxylase
MNNQLIIKHYDPFPFLEIENMYSKDELKLIWQELEFLNQSNKFEGPEETGSAKNFEGELLKQNSGLFLDEIYNSRKISNILTVNQNLFSSHILEEFSSLCFLYENITHTNEDTTLISYYDNGGYYKPHQDHALYTAVTWFFKEPKKFDGGDFYFTDYNLKIEVKNNKTVLFPSIIYHSVDEILMNTDSPPGYGRYVMVQLLYILLKK